MPAYHDALESAVVGDSEIPTVVVDENRDAVVIHKSIYASAEADEESVTEIDTTNLSFEEEVVPLSGEIDSEKRIVDKTYYEDCGTGNGYWIIKYEDGSTSVEQ